MDYPKSVPGVGLVDGKFVDENQVTGTPGSLIPAAWGNAVTDELLGVMEEAAIAPAEGNNGQLRLSIKAIALNVIRQATSKATELLWGVLRIGTQGEVDAGVLDDVAVTPKKLKAAFPGSLATTGYRRSPGGLIEQWGTVSLTAVGAFNAQVIGGVTWYTHFYVIPLPLAYTEAHFEVIATLAGRPNSAQGGARIAFVQTNKVTSGPGESLSGFTLSVTTPETGWVPTIHFDSKGK